MSATTLAVEVKPIKQPKALPVPNSDSDHFAVALPAEELTLVKKVRTYVKTKVAPIIFKYWTEYWTEDSFPFELLSLIGPFAICFCYEKSETCFEILQKNSSIRLRGVDNNDSEICTYSPDVEQNEPDFDRTLQTVLHNMKQHMRGSLQAEGIGRVVRDAHAKGYGLARGEFEILNGMPNEYAQGIYAKPGRHEAMVRFSNGSSHVGDDRFLGPIVGVGVKIFGIEGKTLLEDEPDSHTFDYAMIDHPVFFANTLAHYVFIQSLFANIGVAPKANLSA